VSVQSASGYTPPVGVKEHLFDNTRLWFSQNIRDSEGWKQNKHTQANMLEVMMKKHYDVNELADRGKSHF